VPAIPVSRSGACPLLRLVAGDRQQKRATTGFRGARREECA